MKIHIIGAGPTGMSVAWEILRSTTHDVIIYDKKSSAGGSWWEPSLEYRDMHAHRVVFDRAFANTQSLFNEMGIRWGDVFEKIEYDYDYVLKNLNFRDYLALTWLSLRVLSRPEHYARISLKKTIGDVSEKCKKILSRLTFQMDGVGWDVMSAYEFVKSFDHVGLSNMCTQKVSGKVMCDAMQRALEEKGAKFIFNKELKSVDYNDDTHIARFVDASEITDGYLILCLDNSPARRIVGDNWGKEAKKKIHNATYGCINILIDYAEPIQLKNDLEIAIDTEWNLQPVVLSNKRTVSCLICDLTEEILTTNPELLKDGVLRQLDIGRTPINVRIGWGSEWDGHRWTFSQSSGVLGLKGQVPFFGKSSSVALCGMMSPRTTPYSSLEAAIEVSRSLCHQKFGTRRPTSPVKVTNIIVLLIVLFIVYRYTRR
jgi:hypothetical protein